MTNIVSEYALDNYSIQTYTGKYVSYDKPTLESICIEDIAHHLSIENRFAGATKFPYSVAKHSLLVCWFAPDEFKLEALLHDAEEAYTKDFPTPLLRIIRENTDLIDNIRMDIRNVISAKFNLNVFTCQSIIKELDLRAAKTEKLQLLKETNIKWHSSIEDAEPFEYIIEETNWRQTRAQFLDKFDELSHTRQRC